MLCYAMLFYNDLHTTKDKTGTLTADEFEVDGVAGIAEDPTKLIKARSTTDAYPETARVIAGCHSLVLLQQQDAIIGDPLERAALKSIKWASDNSPLSHHFCFSFFFYFLFNQLETTFIA